MKIKKNFEGRYYYEDGTFKSPLFDRYEDAEKSMEFHIYASSRWSRCTPHSGEDW